MWAWATTDSLVRSRGQAICEEGEEADQIHIYESYILPKHIVVIYNRHASGCFQDFEQ